MFDLGRDQLKMLSVSKQELEYAHMFRNVLWNALVARYCLGYRGSNGIGYCVCNDRAALNCC